MMPKRTAARSSPVTIAADREPQRPPVEAIPASLYALAVSVGDKRKGPGQANSRPSTERQSEIKLVSGL